MNARQGSTSSGMDKRVAIAGAAVIGAAALVLLMRVMRGSRGDDEDHFEHIDTSASTPTTKQPAVVAATKPAVSTKPVDAPKKTSVPTPAPKPAVSATSAASQPATQPARAPAAATPAAATPAPAATKEVPEASPARGERGADEDASSPLATPPATTIDAGGAALKPSASATMERSTAREDAIALAMEASCADDMMDDPDVAEIQREAYAGSLEMDATCALAWYKLGTYSDAAVLPFTVTPDPNAEPGDWKVDRRAKQTTVAPIECTRRAVDLVERERAAGNADAAAELQEGWSLADAYFNLGHDAMHRAQRSSSPPADGSSPSQQQTSSTLRKSTVTIAGAEVSWVACLSRAVDLDPSDPSKWMELAQAIDDDDDTDGTAAQTATIAGSKFTARDMYHRVATGRLNPSTIDVCTRDVVAPSERSMAWQCLGVSLAALGSGGGDCKFPVRNNDVPELDIRSAMASRAVFTAIRRFKWPGNGTAGDATSGWTALECLQAALVTVPMSAMVWTDLAKHLIDALTTADERSDAEALSPVDCVAAALDIEPSDADVWTLLASCIDAGFARDRPEAEVLSKPLTAWRAFDCLVQAVERDTTRAEPWYNLALVAPNGASIQLLGNMRPQHYSTADLFAQALARQSDWGAAWARLGHVLVLQGQQSVAGAKAVVNGETVAAVVAFKRAAEQDPSLAMAWAGLALVLTDSDKVVIRGVTYGRLQCAAKRDSVGGVEASPAADDDEDDGGDVVDYGSAAFEGDALD